MAAIEEHTARLRIFVKDRVARLEDGKLIARPVFPQVLIRVVFICRGYTYVVHERVNNNDVTNALTISVAVSRPHRNVHFVSNCILRIWRDVVKPRSIMKKSKGEGGKGEGEKKRNGCEFVRDIESRPRNKST